MPKYFGKGRNQHRRTDRFIENTLQDDRNHYGHDDRGASNHQHRRGGIKNGRIERYRPKQDGLGRVRNIIEEDVDMSGSSSQADGQRRFTPYVASGRKNRERSSKGIHITKSTKSGAAWSKIWIQNGKKYAKDYILRTLLNATKIPFLPVYYHYEGNNVVFYVEDTAAADALSILNHQITLNDHQKLKIRVSWSPAPNAPVNEEVKEKIKQVMSRRYDPATKILNLVQFHLDEEFATDYYTPLSRENVLHIVMQIITEHIPDVQTIDMSTNKIFSVDQMKILLTKAPFLKSLNLGNNKLGNITDLDRLNGLQIEELILNQNPLCDRFDDQSSYISAVRKRFPKVVRLDGVELPPVISFDVGADDVTLPVSKGSFFINDQARQIALVFLEQYLSLYDSDNRQLLLEAYYDSAVFSLTLSYPPGQTPSSASRLDSYMKESRNLKRVEDSQRRSKLLHQGKVEVVSFVSKLPRTQHDPQSMVVDIPVASAHLMVISVTGIFRERAERHTPIRWFERVFIIIPHNGGFCIVNEQLHITPATTEQIKNSFKESVPTTLSPVETKTAVPVPVPQTDPILQQQMIVSFSEQSGMNAEWSQKCLEENNWDFDRAAFVFTELKKNNNIPPEAFIK